MYVMISFLITCCLALLAFLSLMCHFETDSHFVSSSDVVIVTSHFKENLNWLRKSKYRVVLCDKPGASSTPFKADTTCSLSVNRGREASSFLKYIVENYDSLPPYIAFIHGHERAWHQKLPFSILEAIDRARKHDFDYINLNNVEHSKIYSKEMVQRMPSYAQNYEVSHIGHHLLKSTWAEVFEPILKIPFPEHLRFMCCAQFVVSSRAIRKHPKEAYQKLLDFTLEGPDMRSDWARGVAIEFIWHLLLGGEAADRCSNAPAGECGPDHYLRTRFA